jgi:hypothetical protein
MGYKFPKREIGVILGGLVHPWLGGMLKEKYDAENRAPQDKANAAATNNIMEAASNPAMNASNGLMLSNIPQSVSTQRRSPESDRADGRTMFDAQPSLLNPNGSGPNIDPLVVPKDMNFQRRATPNGWVTDGDMTETKFLPEGGPPQQSLMPQPFTRTPQQSPLMNTQGYSQPENRQLQGPPNKATQDVRRAIEQGLRSTQAGQRPMNKNEFNGAPQIRPTAAAVEGYNPLGSIERNNYATQQLGRMDNLTEGQKLQVNRSLAQMAPKEAPTTVDVYNERTGKFERASNDQIAASPWLRPTAAAPKDPKRVSINDQLVDEDTGVVVGDYRTSQEPKQPRYTDAGDGIPRWIDGPNMGEEVFPGVAPQDKYTGSLAGVIANGGTLGDAKYFRSDDPAYLAALQTGMPIEDFRNISKAQEKNRVDRINSSAQVAAEIQPLQKVLEAVIKIQKNPDTTDVTGSVDNSWWLPTSGGGFASDNINARADIDYLSELAKNVGMQMTRAASPTGSAGGTISEKEWPIMAARLGNLNLKQKDSKFLAEMAQIETEMTDMIKRLNENHALLYGDVNKNASGTTINWKDLYP